MSGNKIWGYYPAGNQHVPIQVDANGRVQVYDLGVYSPPLPLLNESWQNELGINASLWNVTNPATGTAWVHTALYNERVMLYTVPNANETARLRSIPRWTVYPDTLGVNSAARRFILEFEMQLANVGNIDNALSFFGFSSGGIATRATNNIAGFTLVADALQTMSDDGGAETTNTGFGETLTDLNLFHIESYPGHMKFFLNRTEIADHEANFPQTPCYLNWYIDTEAGGNASLRLGSIRTWMEDILR